MKTFHPPRIAATTTAYGTHSDLTMKVPTINSAEGIYMPCTYCVANGDDGSDMVDALGKRWRGFGFACELQSRETGRRGEKKRGDETRWRHRQDLRPRELTRGSSRKSEGGEDCQVRCRWWALRSSKNTQRGPCTLWGRGGPDDAVAA